LVITLHSSFPTRRSSDLKVDVRRERVVGVVHLPRASAMPQDVKLSPDGKVFYVADMASNGIWEIDRTGRHVLGFIHTGAGGRHVDRKSTRLNSSHVEISY